MKNSNSAFEYVFEEADDIIGAADTIEERFY